MSCAKEKSGRGYHLSLSDGKGWWLAGDEVTQPWVDRLATIMGLMPSPPGISSIVFAKKGDTSKEGWLILQNSWEDRPRDFLGCDDADIRIWSKEGDFTCEIGFPGIEEVQYVNMWNSLYPIFHGAWRKGGIPFHGALLEKNGKAILLIASGGKGKSTSSRRIPFPWRPLCDDEALVVMTEKGYMAHPFPTWSDYIYRRAEKTWDVHSSVPLHGIFLLTPSEEDRVIPLSKRETATAINISATQVCKKFWKGMKPEDIAGDRLALFHNACAMAQKVPGFYLLQTLHGRFWEKIEEALEWEKGTGQ